MRRMLVFDTRSRRKKWSCDLSISDSNVCDDPEARSIPARLHHMLSYIPGSAPCPIDASKPEKKKKEIENVFIVTVTLIVINLCFSNPSINHLNLLILTLTVYVY